MTTELTRTKMDLELTNQDNDRLELLLKKDREEFDKTMADQKVEIERLRALLSQSQQEANHDLQYVRTQMDMARKNADVASQSFSNKLEELEKLRQEYDLFKKRTYDRTNTLVQENAALKANAKYESENVASYAKKLQELRMQYDALQRSQGTTDVVLQDKNWEVKRVEGLLEDLKHKYALEMSATQQTIKSLEYQKEILEADIKKLREKNSALGDRIAEKEALVMKERNARHDDINALNMNITDLNLELSSLQTERTALQLDLDSKTQEIERLKNMYNKLELQSRSMSETCAKAFILEKSNADLLGQLQAAHEYNATLTKQVETLNLTLAGERAALEDNQYYKQYVNAANHLQHLEKELVTARNTLQAVTKKGLEELRATNEAADQLKKNVNELNERVDRLNAEKDRLADENENIKLKSNSQKTEIDLHKQKIASLREEMKNMASDYAFNIKTANAEAENKIGEITRGYQILEQQWQEKIAQAGKRTATIVAAEHRIADASATDDLIADMTANHAKQLDNVRKQYEQEAQKTKDMYENRFKQLREETKQVRDENERLKTNLYSEQNAAGSASEKFNNTNSALQAAKHDVQKLQDILKQKDIQIAKLQTTVNNKNNTLSDTRRSLSYSQVEVSNMQAQLDTANNEISRLKSLNAKTLKDISRDKKTFNQTELALKNAADNSAAENKAYAKQIVDLKSHLQHANNYSKSLEQTVKETRSVNETLVEQNNNLKSQLKRFEKANKELESEIARLKQENNTLFMEKKQLSDRVSRLENTTVVSVNEVTQRLKKENAELQRQVSTVNSSYSALNARQQTMKNDFENERLEYEKKLANKDKKIQELQKLIDQYVQPETPSSLRSSERLRTQEKQKQIVLDKIKESKKKEIEDQLIEDSKKTRKYKPRVRSADPQQEKSSLLPKRGATAAATVATNRVPPSATITKPVPPSAAAAYDNPLKVDSSFKNSSIKRFASTLALDENVKRTKQFAVEPRRPIQQPASIVPHNTSIPNEPHRTINVQPVPVAPHDTSIRVERVRSPLPEDLERHLEMLVSDIAMAAPVDRRISLSQMEELKDAIRMHLKITPADQLISGVERIIRNRLPPVTQSDLTKILNAKNKKRNEDQDKRGKGGGAAAIAANTYRDRSPPRKEIVEEKLPNTNRNSTFR